MEDLLAKRHQLLQKASYTRSKVGGRCLPKIPEVERKYCHWDYVLEEMKWLSSDVMEDRKHKTAVCLLLSKQSKQKFRESSESRCEAQHKEISKKASDMVQVFFAKNDDKVRFPEGSQLGKTIWKVDDVKVNYPSLNIILEKVSIKPKTEKIGKVEDYVKNFIHCWGYSQPKILEKIQSQPSTPETSAQEVDYQDFLANFKLFYDIEDLENKEQELKTQLETLHIEDYDIYGPPLDEELYFRDITEDQFEKDKQVFELLPDPEEQTLWESTQETEEFAVKIEPFSSFHKQWQIFDDMTLEKLVCEFGGVWDLIGDLMGLSVSSGNENYSPDECANRWVFLQRRKGKFVPHNFKPQQVLYSKDPPLQGIKPQFSLFPIADKPESIKPPIKQPYVSKKYQDRFDFLVHNLSAENNEYFYHYQEINSKFYQNETTSKRFKPEVSDFSISVKKQLGIMELEVSEEIKMPNPIEIAKNKKLEFSETYDHKHQTVQEMSGVKYPRQHENINFPRSQTPSTLMKKELSASKR